MLPVRTWDAGPYPLLLDCHASHRNLICKFLPLTLDGHASHKNWFVDSCPLMLDGCASHRNLICRSLHLSLDRHASHKNLICRILPLILDSQASHKKLWTLQFCNENNAHVFCLPSHKISRPESLDRSFLMSLMLWHLCREKWKGKKLNSYSVKASTQSAWLKAIEGDVLSSTKGLPFQWRYSIRTLISAIFFYNYSNSCFGPTCQVPSISKSYGSKISLHSTQPSTSTPRQVGVVLNTSL